jgi:hypothetical protein
VTWKFWKWHRHQCRTMADLTGCWGECIVCGERFGFVTRAELRAYCDRDIGERLSAQRAKEPTERREG